MPATAAFAPAANTCRLGAGVMSAAEASEMLAAGMSAPLSITNAKGETGFYWLVIYRAHGCEVLGYRLISDDEEGRCYDLPASLDHCECPDFQYRSHKRGPCKHCRALNSIRNRNLIP